MTTAVLQDLEKIASEHERSHSTSCQRHPTISLSGDRAGLSSPQSLVNPREVQDQLFGNAPVRSLEPNYSDLVLLEYRKLQELYDAQDRGEHNQDEIELCLNGIAELEMLEGEQVEEILTARLHMPLGEEAKLQQTTEALLKKYGPASGDS